jgi:hypothetical protein
MSVTDRQCRRWDPPLSHGPHFCCHVSIVTGYLIVFLVSQPKEMQGSHLNIFQMQEDKLVTAILLRGI